MEPTRGSETSAYQNLTRGDTQKNTHNTLEFLRLIFEKPANIKFHENSSERLSCSVRTDRRTDMTKLIVAFRNFAKKAAIRITDSLLLIAGCSLYQGRRRYIITTDTTAISAVLSLSQPNFNRLCVLPNVRNNKLLLRVQLLPCTIGLIPESQVKFKGIKGS
jgi:hypothetical protein